MIALLDLEAPIVPASGLGGIEIGRHISEYADVLRAAAAAADTGLGARLVPLWLASFQVGQAYDWEDSEFERVASALRENGARVESGRDPLGLTDHVPTAPQASAAMEIGVDIRDGIVVSVAALRGYDGRLFDALRTGMTFSDALAADDRLRYDHGSDEVLVEGVDGVAIALEANDPEPDELPRAVVDSIAVFDPTRGATAKWGLPR